MPEKSKPTGIRLPTGSRQVLLRGNQETETMTEARRKGRAEPQNATETPQPRVAPPPAQNPTPDRPARVNGAEWERTSNGCFCDHCGALVRFTVLNSRTDARCVGCGLEWEGKPGEPWKRWER